MYSRALSAGKVSTLKPIKLRGNVSVEWKWEYVYKIVEKAINAFPIEKQQDLRIDSIDPTLLQKTVAFLFEHTPNIESAKLLECTCGISQAHHKQGPYLQDLNSASDKLVLCVRLGYHLAVRMKISLTPVNALVRSKGELLDSMEKASKLFTKEPKPDKAATSEKMRSTRQIREIESLLTIATNAKGIGFVLVVMKGLINVSKNGNYPVSGVTIEKLLLQFRPNEFPNKSAALMTIETAVAKKLVTKRPPTKFKRDSVRYKIEPAGEVEIARLLSQA